MEIVKPKTDIVFKKIFTDADNRDLLQDFLSAILDIPNENIKNIQIKNTEIPPETVENKFIKLDINLEVNNELINIEMQVNKQSDFNDRVLFYWAKLYTSNLKSGETYGKVQKSISINIIDFDIFDCKEFHSLFMVMEKNRHETLSDKCQIHFLELTKISKNPCTKLEQWLKFIDAESESDLDMLAVTSENTNNTPIKKAIMVVKELSSDDKIKELVRLREKALHDEASALNDAKNEGIELGSITATETIAANMLKQSTLPKEQIALLTNLPLEKIEELEKELSK